MALALIVSSAIYSQDKKMWLAGNIGLSNSETGDIKNNWGSFGPEFGYMLNENLAVALSLVYTNSTTENSNAEYELVDNSTTITPFLRYYKSLNDNCALFGQLNIPYTLGSTKETTAGTTTAETSYSGFGVNVKPGIQYWFDEKFSVLAMIGELGYESRTDKDDLNTNSEDVSSSGFNLALDWNSMQFALVFHF